MVAARDLVFAYKAKAHALHEYFAAGHGKTVLYVPKGEIIFKQGGPADSVFYIQKGRVKISVSSPQGKRGNARFAEQG
jgi:CRP-like cAMP-binding protein